jgi:glycosyltransferase involved in cell wall biosynthesis
MRPVRPRSAASPIYRPAHRIESENGFTTLSVDRAAADERAGVPATAPNERNKLAYFALDLPHKGQASYVHINEIVDNLRKLGWRVDLFAPRPGSPDEPRNVVAKAYEYLRATWQVSRSLGAHDAVYVRAHALAWPVAMAARLRGRVLVEEVNGTELDLIVSRPWLRPLRPLLRWLYVSQYRRSQHLFPVANELADWLRAEAGHDRISVVPNAANTDLFRPMDSEPSEPFVVFFGGLTDWHGVDVMIDAVRDPSWPAGIRLVVIGRGVRQNLVEDAVRAGLPIRWLGYRPYEQIPGLIAGAIAGLIPMTNPLGRSSTGMNPLKLFETLACGIPTIVSDLPGQADLVGESRCGLVVPGSDPAALARAVAHLAANPDEAREMGRRGAALVRTAHSWRARAVEIDRVLRACLAGAAR